MFDFNQFKRSVKEWITANPSGSELELRDFCEESIPANLFTANEWLVDQTLAWYKHIVKNREAAPAGFQDFDSDEV